jgi:alanyl-tRNA synthetase
LEAIEAEVNRRILGGHPLHIAIKPLQQAINEGATALFGEKYGEIVRNITIGEEETFSNELCGGTHVDDTGDIGLFLITSEGSAAAGIRRIEAVTGRAAYELVHSRLTTLKRLEGLLETAPETLPEKLEAVLDDLDAARKQIAEMRKQHAMQSLMSKLETPSMARDVPVLAAAVPEADADALRSLADRFRQRYPSGVAVLASVLDGKPTVIAAVTEDLVKRGLHAGELVKFVAGFLGGGGGGKPTLAQAGGKDPARMDEALAAVTGWVESKL